MNIGILNVYDIRNRGDLAILLCEMEWLRRQFPEATFQLFSRFHQTNATMFPTESVPALFASPPGVAPVAQLTRLVSDHWKARFSKSGLRKGRFEAFDRVDFFALTGGGYLYSSRFPLISRNLITVCQNFLAACATGKPVLQFPQSFGPITKALDRHYVRRVCAALPQLAPRCEISMNLLRTWGFSEKAVVIPDIVLMMRELFPSWFAATQKRDGLGIAPVECGFAQSMEGGARKIYLEKLADVGEWFFRKTGESVKLFSQVTLRGSDDDTPAIRDLEALLNGRGVPVSIVDLELDLEHYIGEFQRLRAFVGCRMHSCIFSFVSHTPVIGLAYQPKFIGTFQAMESEGRVRAIGDWTTNWATKELEQILLEGDRERTRLGNRLLEVVSPIDRGLSTAFESIYSDRRTAGTNAC